MKQLYEQVHADAQQMQFCAECEISGKRIYSRKLPLLCRSNALLESLEKGRVGGIRQRLYNSSHASATQDLARYFNQCRRCGEWVCDEMYNPEEMICMNCKNDK